MCEYLHVLGMAAQGGGGSQVVVQSSESKERVVRANAEDYSLDKKDYTAVKVICLGDSAVGKSKWGELRSICYVVLNRAQHLLTCWRDDHSNIVSRSQTLDMRD